jgi:hypothetical protein
MIMRNEIKTTNLSTQKPALKSDGVQELNNEQLEKVTGGGTVSADSKVHFSDISVTKKQDSSSGSLM